MPATISTTMVAAWPARAAGRAIATPAAARDRR
jgi:hypothetical protein